ncbi:prolyl 3,4-dihydroxylase Tpa1p [[Candida] anglica]|uniref:Prolyl 3,4-dihydroxylase Tpa1p n=1 Tax=[Candida] anglica TaxID=148631 RepID=A0ABP0EKT2_9ASCO
MVKRNAESEPEPESAQTVPASVPDMVAKSEDTLVTGNDAKRHDTNFSKTDIKSFFNAKIWDQDLQEQLRSTISQSQPYRWGSFTDLIDDTLLRQVRKEVLSEIAFSKKETDIYKVYQSGDLANLSGLDWDDLSRLPSLFKLRAAIYSDQFRDIVSTVTGCGKLSGVKTDMSINTYTKGCHLLTHDDVIGSRRVSFILYLPEPDREWKASYGGALRLFPSVVENVPESDFHSKFVPQFNQMAFFTVQPGLSFHDVEEVRVDRQRLSIQGWFHIPQPGEEGWKEGEQEETEARSTLQQLQSKELEGWDRPRIERKPIPQPETKSKVESKNEETGTGSELTGTSSELTTGTSSSVGTQSIQKPNSTLIEPHLDLEQLSKYINPLYLLPSNISSLLSTFSSESIVEIPNILKPEYAQLLRSTLIDEELEGTMPTTAKDVQLPWKCAVPPHKQRYLYIDEAEVASSSSSSATAALAELSNFLKSTAFHQWLAQITGLIATTEQVLVRRFRPGHDFILATTTEKNLARNDEELNVLLEATLNLTPTATNRKNWESGEFGGYELCMAMDEERDDDDPAVYRANNPDDDSVLYTSQCKWNSLCLMLRDPSVLKFVKYVSINAKGSRWDISAQWNVKDAEDDDDEDEDEDEEEKDGE